MKQFLTGLLVIMVAFMGAAFTQPKKAGTSTDSFYYRYQLTDNNGIDNPANYLATTSFSGCGEGNVVCIIEAPEPPDENDHPVFEEATNPYDNEAGITVYSEKP